MHPQEEIRARLDYMERELGRIREELSLTRTWCNEQFEAHRVELGELRMRVESLERWVGAV